MADKTIKTIIQIRRDTTENWNSHKSYVPEAGEPCMDLDTGLVVWGDGSSTYEELVSASARENVIEIIKAAGKPLVIHEKSVDIPVAAKDSAGLVMGSELENHVSVDVGGSMEVNSVNISKLVQTEGDTLILDGGTSDVK